jgi:hypothetical protein
VTTGLVLAKAYLTWICIAASFCGFSKHVRARFKQYCWQKKRELQWLLVFASRMMHVRSKHTNGTALL